MAQAYGKDLAYIHDAGFGDFARDSAPGLLDILRHAGICRGMVVDLGCGSGIWAKTLTDHGYDVMGFDLSPNMLKIARKRAPVAQFKRGSFLKARLPNCAAVTSLGECFNYLFDPDADPEALAALFKKIHKVLQPGGLLIFDFLEPGYVRGANPIARFIEGKDWHIHVEITEDRTTHILTRRITAFRRIGKLYRRDQETHRLQLRTRSEIADKLRAAGFAVRSVRGYGDKKFRPAHVGFIARRP